MASSRRARLVAAAVAASATASLALTQAGATPAVGVTATGAHLSHGPLSAGPKHIQGTVGGDSGATLPQGIPHSGRYTFLVKLGTTSSLTTFNHARSQGESIKSAGQAANDQAAAVAAAQRAFIAKLPAQSTVLYKIHNVMAGVAVTTNVKNYAALANLSNVTAIYPITPKTPSTSYAVPLQNGPAAWSDLAAGTDGQAGKGVRIADIDTGLDYTHADFGGPGKVAAFDAAKAASAQTGYPDPSWYDPNKFDARDSYDLVGDSYNADSTDPKTYQPVPSPDDNPLDCDGHGTHTAGIAAGYGEDADGATYTGPYDSSTISTSTSTDWKIGPGMAPLATLIAFRVFGCSGSSSEVTHALDMAIDLNTDSNPNNDVNVINMSLGSDYAPSDDGDAIAAADAVAAGINVVVASGNDDDVVDMGGSPGDSPQVLTVAASGDAQEVDDKINLSITGGSDPSLDGAQSAAGSRSIMYAWGKSGEQYGAGDMPSDAQLVSLASVDPTDADACAAIKDPNGTLAGKIVVVTKWHDAAPECGSITRGANVRKAGGVGFLFLSDRNSISAGINGDEGADGIPDNGVAPTSSTDKTDSNDAIPGLLVVAGTSGATPTDSALINAALDAGATITISSTEANAAVHKDPTLDNSLADFSSRGVHALGNVKPDVAAVGLTVSSAGSGTGNQPLTESGTSMATPMVAGLAALVVGKHGDKTPDNPNGGWTPEMVKADIMNTADTDVTVDGTNGGATYAPNRVGSGRIDADAALRNDVLAYNADDHGSVSLSYGPVEVPIDSTSPYTALKTIKVQNTGTTAETYTVNYNAIDSIPGVDYKLNLPGGGDTVTVQPGATERVVVTLEIDDPTKLDKSIDASYWDRAGASDPNGFPAGTVMDNDYDLPAETLADASGNVVFTPADDSIPTLRVPVYSAPRPTSDLSISPKVALNGSGHGTVTPQGAGLAQGTKDSDPSNDIYSIATGFELQATSPALPRCSTTVTKFCIGLDEDSGVDLKSVGTTSDYPLYSGSDADNYGQVYFGVSSYGENSTPTGRNEYDISIDVNGDGTPDLLAYDTTLGYPDTAAPIYVVNIVDLRPGSKTEDQVIDTVPLDGRWGDTDMAIFDSDVQMLPVPVYDLESVGLKKNQPINYRIDTYDDDSGAAVDSVSGLSMNPFKPAVMLTEKGPKGAVYGPLVDDQGGLPLDLTVNKAQLAADHGLGLMYVHFHNEGGYKVDTAKFSSQSLSVSASGLKVGKRGTVSVSVSGGAGSPAATGSVTVKDGGATIGRVNLAKAHSFSWTPKKAGRIALTATYTGDANYSATTATSTVTVAKATPSLTVKPSTMSPKYHKTFTVRVTITRVPGVTPTGAVTLRFGGVSEGSRRFSNGATTFTVSATKKGARSLIASFAGDGNYAATSKGVTVKVG